MFFVRGYLELLIASLIAKVNPETNQNELPSDTLNSQKSIEKNQKMLLIFLLVFFLLQIRGKSTEMKWT